MKLAHVADLHFGAALPEVMAAAREEILRSGADALIVSGDVTQRGKRSEFDSARAWVDDIGLPALVVPGNHDTPLLNMHARTLEPFARYTEYFGDLTRPLSIDAARIYPLNTARGWQARHNWAEGVVNLSDLQATIDAEEDSPHPRLIACHHPFKSLQGAPLRTRTKRGDRASKHLAASSIDALLTGHVHTPHVEEVSEGGGQYLAISAGTLSTRLRNTPPSLNLIDLQTEEITVTSVLYRTGSFEAVSPVRYALLQ